MDHGTNVQVKAQAELDAVVNERLPSFNDRDSLPVSDINAVWKEVLRWHAVAPVGTFSRTSR